MDEEIRQLIKNQLLQILRKNSENMDAKQLRDCAAVLKETASNAAPEGVEYGVIVLPEVVQDETQNIQDEAPGNA